MFSRIRSLNVAVLVILTAIAGCAPGQGFPVGPFPTKFDLGEGTLDAEALGAAPGSFGTAFVPVPLCELPTRDEAEELLKEQVDETTAAFIELDEVLLSRVVLQAEEGDFTGLRSVQLFYQPPREGLFPSIPVLVAEAGESSGPGDTLELLPVGKADLLRLIDDAEKDPESCVTVYLRVTGITPASPIVWSGEIEADVFGLVRI